MESRGGALRYLLALALVAGLAVLISHRARLRAEEAKQAEPSSAPRRVLVTRAKSATSAAALTIPGTVRPVASTTLFARASGFVRDVKVNIGAAVKKGQSLATIDAPELQDALALARARLVEAEANVKLAKAQADRMKGLGDQGVASKQQVEEAERQYNSAAASVAANAAEVRRLSNTAHYLAVTAPFDGTITKRHVDPGAVVNTGATALFELATTGALKVVVDVPQTMAGSIGKDGAFDVTTKTGALVKTTLLRSADALDEITRTLRVELAVPDGAPLIAGAYVDVKLPVAAGKATRIIPATTLSVGAQGTRVVVVVDGVARYRAVKIVRDLGRELEVTGELSTDDALVMFPPVELMDGEQVTIAP